MPARRKVSSSRRQYTLHLVSDQTGSLANHMITAILTQFPQIDFQKVYHTFQDSPQKVRETVKSIGRRRTIVFHALVDAQSKLIVEEACIRLRVPHFDLTGSLVQFIADHTGIQPVNELSRLHAVDAGYFQRIEAMEFTALHDDGRNLGTLHEADIVIVGLSRVSKSPTATYLGAMGYKTANVSVAPETGFPRELGRVKKKTVAFTVQPRTLHEVRGKRIEEWELGQTSYGNLRDIIREVMEAEAEYRRRNLPILDITGMTIEKIAAWVLKTLKVKRKNLSYL